MNKKRLSVVMAGAMLATSVAPVLAAETTVTTSEYTVGQKELLKKYLNDKLESKKFTTNSILNEYSKGASDEASVKYLGATVAKKLHEANDGDDIYKQSVYTIKIDNTVASSSDTINDLVDALTAGKKIEISEKENTTFLGQVIPAKEAPKAVAEGDKYTSDEMKKATFNANKSSYTDNEFIKDAESKKDGEATLKLEALTDINNTNSNVKLNITTGDVKYDLSLAVDADKNLLDPNEESDLQKCREFLRDSQWAGGYATDAEPVKVETINITENVSLVEEVNYNVDDLYDGTLLTEKGTELLNDLKNNEDSKVELNNKTTLTPEHGITKFEVVYKSKKGTTVKKVVVKSSETKKITALHNMLKAEAYKVGIVAGQNRYETAVNVAKEAGVKKLVKSITTAGDVSNVVLVNGGSLVDGLAAAPLSKHLSATGVSKVAAPLLLTKADSLPKETKDFLNELTEDTVKTDLKEVKIHLVGGETVLSDSLVKELKDMGFSVVRYGGDDREETSIKVAKAISSANSAFVVGANGEADAMSISAEAFNSTTPIIVSSVHGLTYDAIDFLGNQTGNATIIGGSSVLSENEETKIKEAKEDVDGGVKRIAGANRTETNAKILKEYAKTLAGKKVTIVKDGSNKKDELVDALSAANLGGPIVLANSELSNEQLTVLLNSTAPNASSKLLQVGLGLNDSVIKSLSKALNITN